MRVGVYSNTGDGVTRDVLYTLKDGEAVPDNPESQIHKNLVLLGVKFRKRRYHPKDGEGFLKALLEMMRGSYMWTKREDD